MENIFEGAEWGDKFLTKDGRIAIYSHFFKEKRYHKLFVQEDGVIDMPIFCAFSGQSIGDYSSETEDIVGRYDEADLDQIAHKYAETTSFPINMDENEKIAAAYKAGYRRQ